jgi:predicted metal-binding protein
MADPEPTPLRPRLAVCTTCKAGQDIDNTDPRPGLRLYQALAERCEAAPVVELLPVECLSLCERGCSAAISVAGKWSYLLGGLDESMADDLLAYAQSYGVSKTGLVLPSRRAKSLANMVMGRMPPG